MKIKFLKNRAFTLIECVFSILILAIISIYIIAGINNFLNIQNKNNKDFLQLTDVENTVIQLKSNISGNKDILTNIDIKKYDIKVSDLGELYHIKIVLKDNMEKFYEFYISKKS
ncbi:prepilin-type N-terminal cleavage/methylation domain-containing protein [Parvimonas parva]|uniref:prepilin-type N-terminal cleavage/methylation domain-containing protein n=1 Tax=Parvimonas parva TaxID=2769485 RepID=UPI0038B2AD36